MTNDHFSRLCTAIRNEIMGLDEAIADIRTYHAPSECAGATATASNSRITALLTAAGYNRESYNKELRQRTNDKYAYFSGLSLLGEV